MKSATRPKENAMKNSLSKLIANAKATRFTNPFWEAEKTEKEEAVCAALLKTPPDTEWKDATTAAQREKIVKTAVSLASDKNVPAYVRQRALSLLMARICPRKPGRPSNGKHKPTTKGKNNGH